VCNISHIFYIKILLCKYLNKIKINVYRKREQDLNPHAGSTPKAPSLLPLEEKGFS
jgi:hypothetical protein